MPLTAYSVDVVVVHYRTPDALRSCLAAIADQDQPPQTVVVVDTGAAEEGDPHPAVDVRGIEWIAAPSNIGFGAAANLGSRHGTGEALLVLNADVVLEPGVLAALSVRLANHPASQVVAPRIFGANGHIERNARRFPTITTGLFGRTSLLTSALTRFGSTPRQLASSSSDEACRVDWVSGACMLIRRSAWVALGGFDEGYWMYWEDADLCRRVKARGGEVWFEPAARCAHATGASGRSPRTIRAFHDSAARYYSRHVARSRTERVLAEVVLRVRSRILVRRLLR